MSPKRFPCIVALTTVMAWAGAQKTIPDDNRKNESQTFVVDAGGRPIRALEVGSSLHIGARGLHPNTTYEFRLSFDRPAVESLEAAVSFARVTTDSKGQAPPFVLWYESGVIGCSDQEREGTKHTPYTYRTFEEAEQALKGKLLVTSAHLVERDETGKIPPMKLRVEHEPAALLRFPIVPRRSPINDVTGPGSAAAPKRVVADRSGRFTVMVWNRQNQARGAYDIVAHKLPAQARLIAIRDIVSYAAETGFIFYLRYPVGGPTMDIAGRPLNSSPYFEFADSFAPAGDPVWGAVDPTYVPASHPGGTYAAYYVVNHRDVNGWDPSAGGATNLVDVSGGIEIHPVKSWCVNGTDVIIWQPPLSVGNYDVVVDFGQNPAATAAQYQTDGNYDKNVDFLDGADQIGFVVAPDPYDVGLFQIGEDSYSVDDFFPVLGSRTNVDLRACWPACAFHYRARQSPLVQHSWF